MEANLRLLQSIKKINDKVLDNEKKQIDLEKEQQEFEITQKEIKNEIKDILKSCEELDKKQEDFNEEIIDKIENIKLKEPKNGIDGKPGKDGRDGVDGKNGVDGKDGVNGKDGKDGKPGKDGIDGVDGVGIYDVEINKDGELIITLTNGKKINCGKVKGKDGIGYAGVSVTDAKIIDGELVITLSTGRKINAGAVVGEPGEVIEKDPVFAKSPAYSITNENINSWNDKVEDKDYVHTDNNYTTEEKTKLEGIEENANNYVLPEDVVHDSNYVHTDNNFTNEDKEQITRSQIDIGGIYTKISNLNNGKADKSELEKKVKMFHAKIDNSNFQYVKGSADFTYEDVVNTENCIIETQVANEKVYLRKQEFKNINPPDAIAGRYVGFSEIIRVAGEMAELFLFVYDHENLPTDEGSLNNLKDWGDYQYCVSSYQPIVMGNFLVKDITTNRAIDNNAPSSKATGDYVDSQCGVVLDYMQTTFAQNIMTLVGLSYTKKPVIIYDNANGFEASNDDAGDTWHLTGLDLKPYKRLKFYVRSGGDGNANYSPSHIVEMHLDDRAKGSFGYFSADHAGHCPNNRNRHHIVTFIVNGEKTAIQFQHSISIYGTAASNSAGGRTCYLIEGYYD